MIGPVSSSNNIATSSGAFLSSIRSNTAITSLGSACNDHATTTGESSNRSIQRKKSIHEDIRERLEIIFKDYGDYPHSSSTNSIYNDCSGGGRSSSSSSNSKNRKLILSSDRIISHFPDLGDQYAPLFKEILRSMAVLQDGQWVRRHTAL